MHFPHPAQSADNPAGRAVALRAGSITKFIAQAQATALAPSNNPIPSSRLPSRLLEGLTALACYEIACICWRACSYRPSYNRQSH